MKRVYILRPVGLPGPVKIGCSKAPEARLATIAAWSPIRLEIVAIINGGHELEVALHKRFARLALHGEWFGVDAELQAVIDKAAAGEPISIDGPLGQNVARVAANLKSQLARQISDAERHAFGFRLNWGDGRPEEIKKIMLAWHGPFAPPPNPEQQQAIAGYIARLRAMPRRNRVVNEGWAEWARYRDHGVLPTEQVAQ